jgi:hypothetical protein
MIFILLLVVFVSYLILTYGIRPYLRMIAYKSYKGSNLMPFVPVLGAYKYMQQAYIDTGD